MRKTLEDRKSKGRTLKKQQKWLEAATLLSWKNKGKMLELLGHRRLEGGAGTQFSVERALGVSEKCGGGGDEINCHCQDGAVAGARLPGCFPFPFYC